MSPLEAAIFRAQEDVDSFHQGTPAAPKDGTTDWYRLRAAAVALLYLKRVQRLGIEGDPAACERLYREGRKHFKEMTHENA